LPFEFLTPQMRAEIAPRLRAVRAAHGRTLLASGAASEDVYCLTRGAARIVLYSASGREVSVRELSAGEVFGELAALDGGPRSASVVANGPVDMAVMARADFLHCMEASPVAALWLARRLGAEVRRLTERVFELSALNAAARLHCELLRLARAIAPGTVLSPAPTHEELANRIGSNREAVTRELRRLAALGAIITKPRRLEFLELTKLGDATAPIG
jgi:CRP-like cAMP-binding protein